MGKTTFPPTSQLDGYLPGQGRTSAFFILLQFPVGEAKFRASVAK